MSRFEELKVWQRAVELAVQVYAITSNESFKNYDFSLKDQMRRASVSISSNISEGDQLEYDKSSIRHFRISKGSAAELFTQTRMANRIGYLDLKDSDYLKNECVKILSMLSALIKFREKK